MPQWKERLNMTLREKSDYIIRQAIHEALPGAAVEQALKEILFDPEGRVYLVAVGKAAYEMAKKAADTLGNLISDGIVITKYGHVKGNISGIRIFEAGHPVPDENSYAATAEAVKLVSSLNKHDSVLFLLSGGGSALFENPLVSHEEMADITRQLLACGADIVEINTIRKRLSAVKGGRFAENCFPAHVYTIVLSDIIGDPLDMIASGPAYPDSSTSSEALEIADRYALCLSEEARGYLQIETPKVLNNVTTFVTGSVRCLCKTAERVCRELGYDTTVLSASIDCEAREAGRFLASVARDHQDSARSIAFLAGGETVVHLTGTGLGGRNQELALSAASGIAECRNTCVFSFGSDGTDGPTDAAGGYADETTAAHLAAKGIDIRSVLQNNDAYHALKAVDSLIITGPTGTNVNDLAVVLIDRT